MNPVEPKIQEDLLPVVTSSLEPASQQYSLQDPSHLPSSSIINDTKPLQLPRLELAHDGGRFHRKPAILNELPLNFARRHVPVKKPRSYVFQGPKDTTHKETMHHIKTQEENLVLSALKVVASPKVRKKTPKPVSELTVILQTKAVHRQQQQGTQQPQHEIKLLENITIAQNENMDDIYQEDVSDTYGDDSSKENQVGEDTLMEETSTSEGDDNMDPEIVNEVSEENNVPEQKPSPPSQLSPLLLLRANQQPEGPYYIYPWSFDEKMVHHQHSYKPFSHPTTSIHDEEDTLLSDSNSQDNETHSRGEKRSWLTEEANTYLLKVPKEYLAEVNHEEFLKMAAFAERPLTRYVPRQIPLDESADGQFRSRRSRIATAPELTLREPDSAHSIPGETSAEAEADSPHLSQSLEEQKSDSSAKSGVDTNLLHVTDLGKAVSVQAPKVLFKLNVPHPLHSPTRNQRQKSPLKKSKSIDRISNKVNSDTDLSTRNSPLNHILPSLHVHVPACSKPKPSTASRSVNPNGSLRRSILSLEQRCSHVLKAPVLSVTEDPMSPELASILHLGAKSIDLPKIHIERKPPSDGILSLFQLKSLASTKRLIDVYIPRPDAQPSTDGSNQAKHQPGSLVQTLHPITAAGKYPPRGYALEPDPEEAFRERHQGGKTATALRALLKTRGFQTNPLSI